MRSVRLQLYGNYKNSHALRERVQGEVSKKLQIFIKNTNRRTSSRFLFVELCLRRLSELFDSRKFGL